MGKEIIILGIILVLFGTFLLIITKFHPVGLIYGTILIVIGLALILLNKEEDRIEQRKDINTKHHKK
jgi:predicted tellurium resistance membrane protein TerC